MARDPRSRNLVRTFLRNYVEAVFMAVGLALIIRMFVIAPYRIAEESMTPNANPGEVAFGYRLPYGAKVPLSKAKIGAAHIPARWRLIAFAHPSERRTIFLRRVVGVPGDRVEIKKGVLFINEVPALYLNAEGDPIDLTKLQFNKVDTSKPENGKGHSPLIFYEKWSGNRHLISVSKQLPVDYGPQVIPPNSVFVLADQRDAQGDSRQWGVIPVSVIESEILAIWLSFSRSSPQNEAGMPWNRIFRVVH